MNKTTKVESEKLEQLIAEVTRNSYSEEHFSNLGETDKELIFLAAELKSVPVLNVPKAALRRKYAVEKQTKTIFTFSSLFNLKLVGSLATLLIFVMGGLTYFTATSLPGQKLFSVKKSAEQFRVKFASNDTQKAYLQVQIAKKRVAEAQKVAQNQNKNPQSELAAIKEVSQATELATKQVETLSPQTIKASTQPLLSSLEDVNQQEKDLISSYSANPYTTDGKEDVIALSLKNQNKISEIRLLVEIATAEEALANLSADPDVVVVSGQITQAGETSLTVEKTLFLLEEKTVIVSQTGEVLSADNLKLEEKVAVTGKKTEGKLFAAKITLLDTSKEADDASANEDRGEVKGKTVETNQPNSTTPTSILSPNLNEEAVDDDANQTNPNAATGSFIIEDPNPQFVP